MNKQEYIDRAVTIEKIKAIYCADCNNYNEVRCRACMIDDALNCIDDVPAVDVAPVVHGQWIDNGIPDSMLSKCSVCGFGCGAYTFQFCPMCGAIMDFPYIDAENEPSPDDYVDYGGVFINAAEEYKLNTAYIEILRLHEILKNNRVPHEFHRLYDGWQICYPDGDHCKISAIQHYFSYGAADNRIEIMGGITPADGTRDSVLGTKDSVLGNLTAEDVFARIVTMHKAKSTYENTDRCVCCGDVIPEGRQVCPGCEGGVT